MAKDVESIVRQQAALASFGFFAFREADLIRILEEAARVCADALGVHHCKVCRYRPSENDLLIEAGIGWKPGVVGNVFLPADENSPQGRAFVTEQAVIAHDLKRANFPGLPDFYAGHGIVSTIHVPIHAHAGPPFGVLGVGSTGEHAYDEGDVNFLTGFANVLAEAVATRDRNEALRAALAGATATVAEKDRLLNERNLLAREMQHRVRNNLQLISEMVNAQRRQTPDEAARKGLGGIIRKIITLAEVHEHLLGSGMNGTIDLGTYARALCAKLPDLQPSTEFAVSLHCDAASVQVTLASATALGLTITELISNSYEHAFPGRGGTIGVRVARYEQVDQGVITIADDGIGYVQAAETRRHGVGLARRLMQQVEGTLEVAADAGTVWTLRFPVMPVMETAAATV